MNQSRYNSIHGSPAIARQNTKTKTMRRLSVAPVASLPHENEPDLITCPGNFMHVIIAKNIQGTKKAKWDNVVSRIDSIQNEQQIMFREQEQRQQRLEQSKSTF